MPLRRTVRTTCKPSLTWSQRSGLTMSGTGGNSGKVAKAVRGGRLPQLSRFQRTLIVVVMLELLRHAAHLRKLAGAMHGQTFFLIGAVIARNCAILLRVMRLTQQHRDP